MLLRRRLVASGITKPIQVTTRIKNIRPLRISLPIRTYSCDTQKPRFNLSQFGGNKEIVFEMKEIAHYLQNPNYYKERGIKQPKGIILSGPPGTGKTMLAEAIAGEANVPVIIISASELLNRYVGSSEESLREIFDYAKKNSPCILCFDEIDSIANKRDDSKVQHEKVLVNQLLTLLGQENKNVIVIGTTNNFNQLDSAVVRPGRFDKHIVVPLPNKDDRKKIIELHIKNKKIDSTLNIDELALFSSGFSGAKIESWVNEAAIIALRENSIKITAAHFDTARMITKLGIVKSNTSIEEETKKQIAIHEAGHAIVGHVLKRKLYRVSTVMHGQSEGHTEFFPIHNETNHTKETILDEICISLAGRAAEVFNNFERFGSSMDLKIAKVHAISMISEEGMGKTLTGTSMTENVELILQTEMKRAKKIIEQNEQKLNDLVNALLEYNTLNNTQFTDVLAGKKISIVKKTHTLNPLSLLSFFNIIKSLNSNEATTSELQPPPSKTFT
jgi:cell division protease FtsH